MKRFSDAGDAVRVSKVEDLFSGHAVLADGNCSCCFSRRSLLKGVGAVGAAAMLSKSPLFALDAPAKVNRISVHHHLAPPAWLKIMAEKKILPNPGVMGKWSEQRCLDDLDKGGVDVAILSVTTPGVWVGDIQDTRKLTRECNDYAAKMRSDYKGRYGMFGAIYMPDIDGALAEIAYCLDTLKADGIGVFTSYGDKYLGDPIWTPIYEELNRRKAVLYTHPCEPACCSNLGIPVRNASIEYGTDTTRAIAETVFTGTGRKYPNMRMIFSHAGGTMPYLYERFENEMRQPDKVNLPKDTLDVIKVFYYDTAQSANPLTMSALRRLVPVSQILFGSDYPYRTSEEHVRALQEGGVFSDSELRAIYRENPIRLMPKYAG